jgi:DNA uptake protein ComE-like DNA-binding protein
MTFFFSRTQKVILIVLLLAIFSGLGVFIYGRGRLSALDSGAPFFVDAPPRPASVAPPPAPLAETRPPVANAAQQPQPDNPVIDTEEIAQPINNTAAHPTAKPTSRIAPLAISSSAKSTARTIRTAPRGPKVAPKQPLALNTARAEQFQQLPGIGPVLAGRIVETRKRLKEQNGQGFQSKEQLLDVPGIGPKKYADIKDHVKL